MTNLNHDGFFKSSSKSGEILCYVPLGHPVPFLDTKKEEMKIIKSLKTFLNVSPITMLLLLKPYRYASCCLQ